MPKKYRYRIPNRSEEITTTCPCLADEQTILGRLGTAVIEVVEEAIYNSLLMARTVTDRDNNTRYAIPADQVAWLLETK